MSSEMNMTLKPIGKVRNSVAEPILNAIDADIELAGKMEAIREFHKGLQDAVSELVVFPEWEELLDGIEDFSHVMVLYWPHLIDPERRNLKKIHPMGRKDMPLKGIFATRSPARPNPVLVTVAPLVERSGNVLKVKGMDAVDGSLLVDIKPHLRSFHGEDKPVMAPWMEQLFRELDEP